MYSIYALIDPRDNITRYIGITEKPVNQRVQQHLLGNDGNVNKIAWINELDQLGISPIVEVLEQVESKEEALEREIYWIRYYLDLNAPLMNRQGNPSATVSRKLFERIPTQAAEEWISINLAAKRLGVHASRISALALSGKIRTKRDPIDSRLKLVEYNEVYTLFSSSHKYGG